MARFNTRRATRQALIAASGAIIGFAGVWATVGSPAASAATNVFAALTLIGLLSAPLAFIDGLLRPATLPPVYDPRGMPLEAVPAHTPYQPADTAWDVPTQPLRQRSHPS